MTYLGLFLLILLSFCASILTKAISCDSNVDKIVYKGKCETLLEQGSCKNGEWLIYDKIENIVKCEINKCPKIKIIEEESIYIRHCNGVAVNFTDDLSKCNGHYITKNGTIKHEYYMEQALWQNKCIKATENPCYDGMKVLLLSTGRLICICRSGYIDISDITNPSKNTGGCYRPYFNNPCKDTEYLHPNFKHDKFFGSECRKNNCKFEEIEVIKSNKTGNIVAHSPGQCIPILDKSSICSNNEILVVNDNYKLECISTHGSNTGGAINIHPNGVIKEKKQNVRFIRGIGCIHGTNSKGDCKNSSAFLVLGPG